jgi:chromosome segregation ATPase
MQNGREETVAEILSRLAESASTFISAVQELAQLSTRASSAVRHEIDHLQDSFDRLAGAVSEQQTSISTSQEQYQQLSAAVASVQAISERHQAEMGALREEAREQTGHIFGRMEELSARLDGHHVAFSGLHAKVESLIPLHSAVADLSSTVATWCERLDRQEEVLHSLCEMQSQRAAALHQFYEALTRLETPIVLPGYSRPEASRTAAC